MKENFFTSMLMEGGKISHKRVIAVYIAAILGWAIVFAMLKAVSAPERQTLINYIMVFILVMAGVATLPQVIALFRGGPVKDEEPKKDQP